MRTSSNIEIEHLFDRLSAIPAVEPSEQLYIKTLHKVQRHKNISVFWFRFSALLITLFVLLEFYLAYGKFTSTENDISTLVYQTKNTLYDE
jgi:hypothetical protein